MRTEPFVIDTPQAVLDDLHDRLMRARWPARIEGDWSSGASSAYLRELVTYWRDEFDWRARERALNCIPQFRADVDGIGVHFSFMCAERVTIRCR
jgi:hypothetical protein